MPDRPSTTRDFHAIFQGVHALAIGLGGIAAVVISRPPPGSGLRTGLFIGWLLAAAFAWLGYHMVRTGWTRGYYRSFLRWIATIPLAIVWTCIVLLVCLYLYVRATGSVPGFVESGLRAMFGGSVRQPLNDLNPPAPAGWKQTEPGEFRRGLLIAQSQAYDNNDTLPGDAAGRSKWAGEILREQFEDVSKAGKLQSRRLSPIAGHQAWRGTASSTAKGMPVILDTYVLIDAKHDRTWAMTFAVAAPKPRNTTTLQVQFLKSVDLDV